MHNKDFEGWSTEKQIINSSEKKLYFKEREIWWSALGINIGIEIDGKNDSYERPVLILKYINKHSVIVLPLTTQGDTDKYRIAITTEKMNSIVKLAQIKTISTKRLLRKIDTLSLDQYELIRQSMIQMLS
ncbi:MAG: hypothetical protein JWL92_623 [Candidatus Nomurabacteria bacterium]|nr:hypothetical protein [Candidatus Nomurabacteria bacterium]